MAKGKSEGKQHEAEIEDDDGFVPANAERQAPWWLVEDGAKMRGVLLGRFQMQKVRRGSGVYFQIRSTIPMKGITGKGEDAEISEYPAGTVFNIGDRYQTTQAFNACIRDGGKWEVKATVLGKEDIGENEMWNFDVRKKLLEKAPDGSNKGDSIPF